MADIQRYRAHESLNVDTAADWQVQAVTVADTDGIAVNVTGYHQVHLQSDNDFYFTFNTTGTDSDVDTSKDLYLKGGDTIYSFFIPNGLGDSVYLILERKGGSDANIRTILA